MSVDDLTARVARDAAEDEAGDPTKIGDLLGAVAEDVVAVTISFAATDPGYRGWAWCVTLALVDPGHPTVSEVVMLPGQESLLAPAWVPWEERVRPGDLGVGDLLPPEPDDERIVMAYLESDDPAVEDLARELGLGRLRVLSREGRIDAAERWHDGSFGPSSEMAASAAGQCGTCAFYLPLAGSLGGLFGACGNEFAPADGRVVDAGYGCGAHSELVVQLPARSTGLTPVDELRMDIHPRPAPPSADENVGESADENIDESADENVDESAAETAGLELDAADLDEDPSLR